MFGLTPPWFTAIKYGVIVLASMATGAYFAYGIGYDKGHNEQMAIIQKLQGDLLAEKQASAKALAKANTELQDALKKQQQQNDKVNTELAQKAKSASDAYTKAMAQLRKEQASHAINPDTCVLSGAGRVLYDQASGAIASDNSDANSGPASGVASAGGKGTSASCLTISQLETGYLNLAQHAATNDGRLETTVQWLKDNLVGH